MCPKTSAALFAWIVVILLLLGSRVCAADEVTDAAPQRLAFPDVSSHPPTVAIAPLAQPQAAVALPSPQFTGVTALAVLATLLRWRKSILKFVC